MREAGLGLHKGKTALINPKLKLKESLIISRFLNEKMREADYENFRFLTCLSQAIVNFFNNRFIPLLEKQVE